MDTGRSNNKGFILKVDDNHPLHNEIVQYLNNFNWRDYLKCIAMRKIQQFHIINILRIGLIFKFHKQWKRHLIETM